MTTTIRLRGGGEEGIGEDVTYDDADQDALQDAGAGPAAGRRLDARVVLRPRRVARPVAVAAASASRRCCTASGPTSPRRSTSRCARPARRCTRRWGATPQPLTFVISLRLGDPPTLEPVTRRLRQLPDAALQARRDQRLGRRARRRAGGDRRRRLDRLQGPLRGLDRRPGRRPGALPARRRRPARRVVRGSEADARDRRDPRAVPRPHHVGRQHPRRSPTSRACRSRRGWSTSSRRASAACGRCSTPTSTARSAASACTAAASSNSAAAAARSSTSRRSSIPTRPTTSRRSGYNENDPSPDLPSSPLPVAAQPDRLSLGLIGRAHR